MIARGTVWHWVAITSTALLLACNGQSNSGNDTGALGSGGSAGGDAGVPPEETDAEPAADSAACIPNFSACIDGLLCCDGTACLYDGCGIDPTCAGPGQACDDTGMSCCDGSACQDGKCPPNTQLSCDQSIAEHCLETECVTSWPVDPLAFCSLVTNNGMQIGTCAGYDTAYDQGVDLRTTYFYDPSTGELVAIVHTGFDGVCHCLAGPPTFLEPTCDFGDWVSCPDAGS